MSTEPMSLESAKDRILATLEIHAESWHATFNEIVSRLSGEDIDAFKHWYRANVMIGGNPLVQWDRRPADPDKDLDELWDEVRAIDAEIDG